MRTSEKLHKKTTLWEHSPLWGAVVVGALVCGAHGQPYRIIDTRHGEGIPHGGYTLWFRAQPLAGGEAVPVPPKPREMPVTVLDPDPNATVVGVYTPPSDSEAVMLLTKELGAEWMATHDSKSGEVTCPEYNLGHHASPDPKVWHYSGELKLHLEFAHGVEKAVIDILGGDDLYTYHTHQHNDVRGAGFPHRHVPEDNTLFGAPNWPWENH